MPRSRYETDKHRPRPCLKHLTAAEDFHKLTAELMLCSVGSEAGQQEEEQQEEEETAAAMVSEYRVWVHTSSCKGAGTQGRVSIELHGQGGSSGMQPLHAQHDGAFARGQVRPISPPTPHSPYMHASTSCCSKP